MLVLCNCSASESYDEILPFKRLITLLGEIGYTLTNITTHECYCYKYYLLFLDSDVIFTPNPQLLIQIAKLQNNKIAKF